MHLRRTAVTLALGLAVASNAAAIPSARRTPTGMALVGPGVYRPLYPASPAEKIVAVKAFFLDTRPVTNGAFLAFTRVQPEWRRDVIKRVFADTGYLSHWETADTLGPVRATTPVTNVSWFAAKAYCASKGARLPLEREWELAARASESSRDGSRSAAYTARILGFYSEPGGAPLSRDVGAGKPNFWGVYDMHGLVWEWIYDFGASLVATDSRERGAIDQSRFCGAAGADSQDPEDYAAFMRTAFRSSLEAPYTTARLGFRCARSVEGSR